MAKLKFKYLVSDKDRHGNERWYVRKPGQRKIRIREEVGSEAFVAAYKKALAAQVQPTAERTQIKPYSLQWFILRYYASSTFKQLDAQTQKQRRSILNRLANEHGERDARTLTSKAVRAGRDARKDTPGAANNMLKTLKALYVWGIEEELVETNPVECVKRLPMNPDGFHSWSIAECLQFEAAHELGTTPRLVYALALYAGLRRSDIIKIGKQHITEDGYLDFKQEKTNRRTQIYILPPLADAIAASPSEGLHLVQTAYGKPFTAAGIGGAMKKWTQTAKLPPECAMHGLRKALGARLAEAGLSENEIAAVLGHTGTGTVKVYTRDANQKRLAAQALKTLQEQSVPLFLSRNSSVGQKQKKAT